MRTVLMVAEKPSLAASLANLLSDGHAVERKTRPTAVHEYKGTFQGAAALFKFTSVMGHVMSIDFPAKFNNWDTVNPLELFQAPTLKSEANPKAHMCQHLRQESKGIDAVVLWLDCDREGENICFEVLNEILGHIRDGMKAVYRAKFSAITEKDVKNAMRTLGRPDENESLSVDARQELDLRMGCAFTRFQTRYFQGKYGDLDSSLISYGPCQTPTLGLCVDRHDQIQSFQAEKYWTLDVRVRHKEGDLTKIDWGRIRVFDHEIATLFQHKVKEHNYAKVVSVVKKSKSKPRPTALNTVELLRACSSGLGMGPHHTMQMAERLYIQGYISYPRTETTAYPANFDLKDTLKQQAGSNLWGEEVRAILQEGITRPKSGKDVGDHPPITPMRAASEGSLGDAWRVYDLITRHFIATLSPDLKYTETTVTYSIGKENFTSTGKIVTKLGFAAVMHWLAPQVDEITRDVNEGEELEIAQAKVVEKETSPPGYLTESELISLMEKHGIGTDASIPVHVNNICERNFVSIGANRTMVPTNLGIVLVHGYLKIDPELVLPTMRATVEKQLDLIATGKADYQAVLSHTISCFEDKFRYFEQRVGSMDELFEVSFTPLSASGKPMSRCAKCRRFMKYIQQKPSRLYCQTCDETYSLPDNGKIMLYKELKCPLDNFELLLWSSGTRGRTYPLCPYCYNHPPFEGSKKGQGCNQCPHPTCQHSIVAHGVTQCPECENGVLVLDPTSSPKWKIACNSCNCLARVFEGAFRVAVTKEICDCGSHLLDVDFNKNNTPLADGGTKLQGCMFCNDTLAAHVDFGHAKMRHPMHSRGRGRGGRGRGRGRGRRNLKGKAALDQYFV
eukprot:m.310406 g.310406  ORF g.310406 m.310406 type:complete len:847 (-) comp16476_c2_seq4:74-2614(-)